MGHTYQVVQGVVTNRKIQVLDDFDYGSFNAHQHHVVAKEERFKELLYAPGIKRSITISDLRKEEAEITLEYRRVRTPKVRMNAILERLLDIEEALFKLL